MGARLRACVPAGVQKAVQIVLRRTLFRDRLAAGTLQAIRIPPAPRPRRHPSRVDPSRRVQGMGSESTRPSHSRPESGAAPLPPPRIPCHGAARALDLETSRAGLGGVDAPGRIEARADLRVKGPRLSESAVRGPGRPLGPTRAGGGGGGGWLQEVEYAAARPGAGGGVTYSGNVTLPLVGRVTV